MLQYLDKVTLGYAAVLGLQKDTVSSLPMITSVPNQHNSTLLVNNTPGPAVPSTSDTSLPAFQGQSAS
jgi:hypothetical protein